MADRNNSDGNGNDSPSRKSRVSSSTSSSNPLGGKLRSRTQQLSSSMRRRLRPDQQQPSAAASASTSSNHNNAAASSSSSTPTTTTTPSTPNRISARNNPTASSSPARSSNRMIPTTLSNAAAASSSNASSSSTAAANTPTRTPSSSLYQNRRLSPASVARHQQQRKQQQQAAALQAQKQQQQQQQALQQQQQQKAQAQLQQQQQQAQKVQAMQQQQHAATKPRDLPPKTTAKQQQQQAPMTATTTGESTKSSSLEASKTDAASTSSEWDKALQEGKSNNRGQASDFFEKEEEQQQQKNQKQQQPPSSKDTAEQRQQQPERKERGKPQAASSSKPESSSRETAKSSSSQQRPPVSAAASASFASSSYSVTTHEEDDDYDHSRDDEEEDYDHSRDDDDDHSSRSSDDDDDYDHSRDDDDESSGVMTRESSTVASQSTRNTHQQHVHRKHPPSSKTTAASAVLDNANANSSTNDNNNTNQDGLGVLPDVLTTMRQKIESLTLFDSDHLMRLATEGYTNNDVMDHDARDALKRSSQQSISPAVLVSLAHKRYERRRLAAMEIEKVVRSLVVQNELDRVRAILLLLSDDYVRSTNEDARKGGVVALAACAIGMKKVNTTSSASVVGASSSNISHNNTMDSNTTATSAGGSKDNNNNSKDETNSKDDSTTTATANNNTNTLDPAASSTLVQECRDLILASTVHACQDHSQRVRYYACENLCNVVKVIPLLAVQHFFILFEILRSLYADVSLEVRKGAELLDRKMKEIVVHAMNSGTLTAESCMPVFARFVYIRHKPTKRLTLTWLQELTEKLIGSPILEYLHLVLGGIFDMIGDPTVAIRQSALAFLQSVLPKLLTLDNDTPMEEDESGGAAVNFDKILQALVTTMEHPDPFVRKVAMYWMSRIVKAHIGEGSENTSNTAGNAKKVQNQSNKRGRRQDDDAEGIEHSVRPNDDGEDDADETNNNTSTDSGGTTANNHQASAASISVRNSVPHVLPGILLSIGDTYDQGTGAGGGNNKNSFLPDLTTRALAEQTNACLQDAVRRGGSSYIPHLDGFIVALREELDSPGGLLGKNAPATERVPYRMDVNHDGTGIESSGWFRGNSSETDGRVSGGDDAMVMSRLCALHWVIVLYKYVVPDLLKADYAREFIFAIINQLVDDPPKIIVYKSLEVLAKITVPVEGEETSLGKRGSTASISSKFVNPSWASSGGNALPGGAIGGIDDSPQIPMTETSIEYALDILGADGRHRISRDREVFAALIQMHSANQELIVDLDRVIAYMCKLQPSEFVMVSFAVELDRFIRKRHVELRHKQQYKSMSGSIEFARELAFVSSFVQHMHHVLLTCEEARSVRELLKNCVGENGNSEHDRQRCRIFHILLHSFSHNLGSVVSLCLWSGAFRTASIFLEDVNPLDINIGFLLEIDRLVEMLERPLFRHIDILMLENDADTNSEGSGSMLFRALKLVLMILPQSTCYRVLRDRLNSIARFRQSTNMLSASKLSFRQQAGNNRTNVAGKTELYVNRVLQIRALHCETAWLSIRAESFETPTPTQDENSRFPNGGDNTTNIDGLSYETPGKPPRIVDVGSKREERWKMYWTASAH